VTTAVSFFVIGLSFAAIAWSHRRRAKLGNDAGKGMV